MHVLPTKAYRLAYRVLYLVTLWTSKATARLATDFRTLGDAGTPAILLQLPVFAAWLVVRPLSRAGLAGCSALAARLT